MPYFCGLPQHSKIDIAVWKKTFSEIRAFLSHYSSEPVKGYFAQRLNSLSGLISGAIDTGSSHLSKIGSGLPQNINALSKEIHAKRFLENKHVGIQVHYLPYLKQFLLGILLKTCKLAQKHTFKVIMDGSQTGSKHVTLMLSIVVGNRSIPVFWVVRKGKKGHFPTEMHTDLAEKGIKALQQIMVSLGLDATFCLLGDGEFDSVDLQTLCRDTLKIDYVFRTSCDAVLYDEGDKISPKQIQKMVELSDEITSFFIPNVEFSNEKLEKVNFLYWFDYQIYEKPLFLVSSLDNAPDIQYAYAIRFRIETMFKDLKSRGFAIDENRLDKEFSLTNLLIVVALAFCIMLNFGFDNQDNPLKIKVQRIDKKVNSIFTFARLLFKYCKDENIDIELINNIHFVQNLDKRQT